MTLGSSIFAYSVSETAKLLVVLGQLRSEIGDLQSFLLKQACSTARENNLLTMLVYTAEHA